MRLLCINNDGCPELDMGKTYTGEWACDCKMGFKLYELGRPQSQYTISDTHSYCARSKCIYALNDFNRRYSYLKERFIIIDDLHEIEQQEYSTELENA